MQVSDFEALLDSLLAPIAAAAPGGRWLRYEPAFAALSRLREEDDPNLPMGDWERPLKKADWAQVADACTRLLRDDSKDFQIAAWLCDAWVRTHSWRGLAPGLQLINGIAERFWRAAWPALDEDDAERRLAPFIWMNNNLPRTILCHFVLLPASVQRELALTLLDWETAPLHDDGKSETAQSGSPRLSRHTLRERVRDQDVTFLQALLYQTEQASTALQRLGHFLDTQLREQSPSLSKLAAALDSARQAALALLPEGTPLHPTPAVPTEQRSTVPDPQKQVSHDAVDFSTPAPFGTASAAADTTPSGAARPAASPPWAINPGVLDPDAQRAQIYAALATIVIELKKIEPHSPTPYMIERALVLGNLPLPEMISAIHASAGSVDHFFELLGIKKPAQT